MDALATILKTMQAATRAVRITTAARSVVLGCAALVCGAALWRAWRA